MKTSNTTLTNNKSLERLLLDFDKKASDLSNKIDYYVSSHKGISFIILLIYIISISFISFFHEPWGDEAQAWVIARDCTVKELLFEIGHLEGHPPLWWLYLAIFAKTGFPYELGLKLAAIIINSISAHLIIYKAPFPKIINYSIPFTYFLFYQYGVISRCYSFLILGFVLCAIYYNTKNYTPFKLVFSLSLLCMSGAYGLIISFGIAIIWVWDIFSPILSHSCSHNNIKFSKIIRDNTKQLLALLTLLIVALFILINIIPYENTSGTYLENYNSLVFRLFYTFFLLPADSLFFSSYWGEGYLGMYNISVPVMIIGGLIWIIVFVVLLTRKEAYGYKKLLLIPYFIFSAVCANLYMYSHHIGIFALFILFWLWVCFDKSNTTNFTFINKKNNWLYDGEGKLLYNSEWIIFAYIIITSLSWSISSSYQDIIHNYVDSREVINFLKEYNLTDAKIMKPGTNYYINGETRYELTVNSMPLVTAYLPYDNNTYRTFFKDKSANWVVRALYLSDNDPNEKALISEWQNIGYPDVLIEECNLEYIYDKEYQLNNGPIPNYVCVKEIRFCLIFKGYYLSLGDLNCTRIYLREDIADSLNIPAIR